MHHSVSVIINTWSVFILTPSPPDDCDEIFLFFSLILIGITVCIFTSSKSVSILFFSEQHKDWALKLHFMLSLCLTLFIADNHVFFFFFHFGHDTACKILFPWLRYWIQAPSSKERSPNYWTAGEFPVYFNLSCFLINTQ